jgi:ABC-type Mn2+/Zn2+ transport system ATPase subunit
MQQDIELNSEHVALIFPSNDVKTTFDGLFDRSFYREAYKRVMSHPWTKYYIVCDIFSTIVIAVIASQLLIGISDGNRQFVPIHIGIGLFTLFFDKLVLQLLSIEIGMTSTNEFIKDTNSLYSKVHFENRGTKTAAGAKEKKDSARRSFLMVSDWGIPTLIGLVGSGLSILATFAVKHMIVQFVICSSFGGLFYLLYVKKKQNAFTELDKQTRSEVQRISELVRLKSVSFQGGETTDKEMTQLETNIENKWSNVRKKWIYIGIIVQLVNEIIGVVIIILSSSNLTEYCFFQIGLTEKSVQLSMFNTKEYMLFSMVLMQWTNAISNIINFMTQFNGMKSDYDNFVEYWKDVEFAEEPEKMEISKDLEITSYLIKRGEQEFKFADQSLQIPFKIGMKFLVLGPTGHGKSTLVNAILGKSRGITMNIGTPSNYYHLVADMFQAIREKMPSSKITIRDWFKGETDNEFIIRMLILTIERKKIDEILESFGKRIKEKNTHPFDVEINEEISGGQKTALCLATRCYEIEKFNKKILVLDEPEQGLGRRAVKVLNNIYQKYPDITIINSTHLYKFELESLKCNFDMIFWIEHGVVNVYKSLSEMDFLDSLDYE